jgi:hypothetical protein
VSGLNLALVPILHVSIYILLSSVFLNVHEWHILLQVGFLLDIFLKFIQVEITTFI